MRARISEGITRDLQVPVMVTGVPAVTPPLPWRTVERWAWAIVIAIAAVHLWLYRFEMVNLDGISYLELGEAWRDGRWADAVNTYWSPLYAWVLGAAVAVARPTPYWEYPLVHLVNGIITIGALGGFAYLLRGVLAARDEDAEGSMPAAVLVATGYALFLWAAIELLVVWMESPDLLGSIFVFTATGALVRIVAGAVSPDDERRTHPGYRRMGTAVVLGASVGFGYLARASLLPIGTLFLVAPAFAHGRRSTRTVVVAAAAAAAVIVPWVSVMSVTHHRFTTGDAARLNYVWFVNDSEDWPHRWPPHWPHFSGEPGNGTPLHAARRLAADPVVYEFARPIAGTYPMWYDPSWWYDGVHAHVDLKDQLRRLWLSAGDLYRLATVDQYNPAFFNPQPALAALLLMLVIALRALSPARVLRSRLPLWVPPLGACAIYAAAYVEPRYLGAYVVVVWLLAVDAIRPAAGVATRTLTRAAGIAMTCVLAATVIGATWMEAWPALQRVRWGQPATVHASWIEAERMAAVGLRPGDAIGVAGSAQVATRWAHLARVRIVAEVPQVETPKVVAADADAARARMLEAFAKAGARWAVIESPDGVPIPGWTRVAGFPYVVKRVQ